MTKMEQQNELIDALERAALGYERWLVHYAVCSGWDWNKYREEKRLDLALIRAHIKALKQATTAPGSISNAND